MEKLRELIKPEEFNSLKVCKSTLEFVRFEAEVDTKKKVEPVVNKLDNKTIKLKNFSELMRIRAASVKSDFPKRNVWDSFFHDSKDMDEMKPGERPDTVYLFNLPTKWFVPYHLLDEENLLPSEKIFYKIFEKFGPIRYVDIPICDPYRNKMKDHISGIKTSSWENREFFEGYVQFKDYIGFTKCMDVFRDMKLVHKEEDEMLSVDIKVDFDRSKHLSDASVRRREIVRDRLVKKQREKEEQEMHTLEEKKKKEEQLKKEELNMKKQKEQRRKLREEKRKAMILEKLKIKGADEINVKIAKEEKKLIKVQRRLESIRLIEELFKRIKDKRDSEKVNVYNSEANDNELQRFKNTSELEVLNQKQKLHNAIQGRVMLKTVLQGDHMNNYSSSSSDEELNPITRRPLDAALHPDGRLPARDIYEHPVWYGYHYMPPTPAALYQPPFRGGHPTYNMFSMRGRGGYPRGSYLPGPSRGNNFTRRPRGHRNHYRGGYHGRTQYTPEMEEEYMKYFSKFLQSEHDDRITRSRSRSRRSRSRSYSRHRSYTRSRSFSRSVSRSRRSKSRSRGYNNYRRSYSRSRKSRSRSRKSRSRSRKSRSRSRKSRSRSKSRKSRSRSRKSYSRQSRSRSRDTYPKSQMSKERISKDRHKSSSRNSQKSKSCRTSSGDVNIEESEKNISGSPSIKSVDSSKFISPSQMRRERSKSWSLPKEGEQKSDSWSRSPEQNK
ncbi:hypothetical protein WA026_003846 [Henosepilachna vigintioctopunctata]